jgi:hypothetical protein
MTPLFACVDARVRAFGIVDGPTVRGQHHEEGRRSRAWVLGIMNRLAVCG